jgi:hypothetical protein
VISTSSSAFGVLGIQTLGSITIAPTLRQKAYPPDEFIDIDELVTCIDFTHLLACKEGT